ncbi:CDP-diacylglycerol--serine O-phosphatidyltransferase [Nonlabens marinus S1-08]|uniref:CDP-diacylglycerol--serine O-phosphatidyltransferase n=1 Tax=Nonlabens marinus S1-08 TaxID=1454201 RepID=W8VXE0_9FLAO|nr:CDP-diacylglycerol--serine O-phosphatidyltransferase [Nonlabens marinus S1-08]
MLCGCIAALFAFTDDLIIAGIFVAAGIFLDFFDGLAARFLKVSSDLGGELDSMADLITSGLVPGIVMFQLLNDSLGVNLIEGASSFKLGMNEHAISHPYVALIGFLITAASALRLARFNLDTRQTDSFIGLPTPANAIFIISLGIIAQITDTDWIYMILDNPYILTAITLFSCYILNAELPLFALKFKNFGFKGNEIRWVFLAVSVVLILLLQLYAVPCIILIYVFMSLFPQAEKSL